MNSIRDSSRDTLLTLSGNTSDSSLRKQRQRKDFGDNAAEPMACLVNVRFPIEVTGRTVELFQGCFPLERSPQERIGLRCGRDFDRQGEFISPHDLVDGALHALAEELADRPTRVPELHLHPLQFLRRRERNSFRCLWHGVRWIW